MNKYVYDGDLSIVSADHSVNYLLRSLLQGSFLGALADNIMQW